MLLLFMVIIMQTEVFSKIEEWEQFNSSLLIEVTRDKGVFTCTGVAVSKELIITAAHCLEGNVKKVRIFTGRDYNPKANSLEVKDFKVHPDYDPKKSAYRNDIARITLKEPLPAFVNLCPIFDKTIIEGDIYRFGFGARDKKNIRTVITPKLRKVNLQEYVVELNDKFSRSGDSGGPVFLKKENQLFILAVHSTFSHGPEGDYSFNPLLGSYLSWIYQN